MTTGPIETNKDNVVVLDYNLLVAKQVDYSDAIEKAFGSAGDCLGVLVVKNVPDLQGKREKLLSLASTLGNLPQSVLDKAHDPVTEWFGWDRGTEIFNGRPDLAKGSFYANPLYDEPFTDADIMAKFPALTRPNKWLRDDLPELEPAFKTLAQLIVRVATLVAMQCDRYAVSRSLASYPSASYLEDTIATSRVHKGRLLHYYPLDSLPETYRTAAAAVPAGQIDDNLCGWHLDNSSLTGLTSAIYYRETLDAATGAVTGLEPVAPPADAGLYIRTRGGETVRVGIPKDCLAFQIGEALEKSTGGSLRATEHCVFGGSQSDLARNTLAVFCQPNVDAPVTKGLNFAQFSQEIYERNHAKATADGTQPIVMGGIGAQ